ncbi:MAG TPA: hypothetical protein VFW70_21480 [Methylomirabilota bacterium]|nr:hypothetical protein [Methylomirabilota bacterium]
MRTTPRVLLLACVLAAGCSGLVRETWSRPGATHLDLTRDVGDCDRVARYDPTHGQEQGAYGFSVPKNDRAFAACMRARGWEPVSEPVRASPPAPRRSSS